MNKKLLHKTQQVYLVFSLAIFIVVAPLFYFVTEKLYIKDIDESLLLHKTEFVNNSLKQLTETDIAVWNRYNTDIKIIESKGLKNDTIFYTSYFNEAEQENEPYRELNSPIRIGGQPYIFSAKANLVESEDLMTSIALLFLMIIVLLLLGLFIITKKLSLSLWKPFYKTLQQIEDFEIDKKKQPEFSESNIEEFNRLNSSINSLVERNIIIYNNQREFVENAAHELQTPIAVFKAKVDILIQRSDITKGQSEILTSLNNAISKLNRLNKNLLLLSKIDRNQFNKTETFSVKELIKKQLNFFIEQAEQKNIEIKTNFESDFTINADSGLTEVLVSNLLLNAIRHNINDGKINIYLSEGKLEISNTGSANVLPTEKLFSRFFKSNPSGQGNGLGLAIVKKISDIYNWTVSYSYSNKMHSFLVHF